LERRDRHVLQHAARLVRHPFRLDRHHRLDPDRVLHADPCHDAHRVTAHRRQRENVGLYPGAAARIRCSEHQHDRGCFAHVWRGAEYRLDSHSIRKPPARAMSAVDTTVYRTYMCLICGFVYSEADGLPEEGIPPGTRWEDVPMNWSCPE